MPEQYVITRDNVSRQASVANELVVRPEGKGELRETVGPVSDDAVEKAIAEELAEDIRLGASEIQIRAPAGEVTLEIRDSFRSH